MKQFINKLLNNLKTGAAKYLSEVAVDIKQHAYEVEAKSLSEVRAIMRCERDRIRDHRNSRIAFANKILKVVHKLEDK